MLRTKFPALLLLPIVMVISGFAGKYEIPRCFIDFKNATGLTVKDPDRLPESAEKIRKLQTEHGEVMVSRVDGYRVLYCNAKQAPFVNLKVELSASGAYETDQQLLKDNLRFLAAHSLNMETDSVVQLEVNGYKVYGISRKSIDEGSTLGTYIMFPGDGVTVYFYFQNLKPEYKHFSSVEEYKKLRDRFFEEYTRHLSSCK